MEWVLIWVAASVLVGVWARSKGRSMGDGCDICNGTGWVCENHPEMPSGDGAGECNCGAARPCVCNPGCHVAWQAVYASTAPDQVDVWAH